MVSIKVERVEAQKFVLDRFKRESLIGYPNPEDTLRKIEKLASSYLEPQIEQGSGYVVLYRKPMTPDIISRSIFGERYLSIAHPKQTKLRTPDQIILMTMGLYVLGTLSRYYPELWNPFVDRDETGERLVVQRFLSICSRALLNLVLNRITNQQFLFVQPSGHSSRQADPQPDER